eukprot:9243192-Ditylum_brightwellii.AAC.1
MTDEKGIWIIEATKEKLQKAIEEVDNGLDALQNDLPDTCFTKNPAFPVTRMIPNYGVLTVYTKKITSMIEELQTGTKQTYSRPPTGAW